MGRGGPPDPEVIVVPPTVEALVELSRSGRHAASDHLETAALVGVATVGCRRCGGGLAGAVASSNVGEGARVAASLRSGPRRVRRQRSGRCRRSPPTAPSSSSAGIRTRPSQPGTSTRIDCFSPTSSCSRWRSLARSGRAFGSGSLPPCAPAFQWSRRCSIPVRCRTSATERSPTSARHRPTLSRAYETISRTSSAPEVVHVSGNLADRAALRSELEEVSADVYLVELKAAAIDVVAEAAIARGADGRARGERRRIRARRAGP